MITICGRYYLKISIDKLLEKYGIIDGNIHFTPSGEIFPSQEAPIIVNDGVKNIRLFKWGFSPSYTNKLIINARAETIDIKNIFKKSFQKNRCIIPTNGFFEWKKQGNKKIKHRIYFTDQKILSLAGLYGTFPDKSGELIKSFTIITTKANKKVEEIHDRMPAILTGNNIDNWLNPEYNLDELKKLLRPYDQENLVVKQESKNIQMKLDF